MANKNTKFSAKYSDIQMGCIFKEKTDYGIMKTKMSQTAIRVPEKVYFYASVCSNFL